MHDWLQQLQTDQRVLDLCSGTGSFSPAGLACSVVALDEDTAAFENAAPLQPGPHYRTFGKSDQIPFSNASFDLVICHHGLEHIPTVETTLREIGRVLKPDGRLVVSRDGKTLTSEAESTQGGRTIHSKQTFSRH